MSIMGRLPLALRTGEDELAEAEVRLQQAKLEAILGIRYDSEDYDRLVTVHRVARQRANVLRQAEHVAHLASNPDSDVTPRGLHTADLAGAPGRSEHSACATV